MKRILLSFVFVFLMINSLFAQRDTEHWIAPYYASTSFTQALYLSTDSTVPVTVTIESNNIPLNNNGNVTNGTITVTKGAPQVVAIPIPNIAANVVADAFNIITKGLHLTGTAPFYCTLRLVNGTTHAEILTSKGRAALGNEFYVAATPSIFNNPGNNFTAGIIASQDNTVVTATWNGQVSFIGGAPATNTHTVNLQKGQSFIFAGSASTAANAGAFIGAKIVSSKPITLTNGNMGGNFGLGSSLGTDGILDQSLPTNRLGNTFAMVRTRSTLDDLEGGIVIATEDNTQIYLNDNNTTPIATINAGQSYRISGSNYIVQGTSGHSNMLITTSKNVYLYQFVAVGTSNATCGFNFIPPLNCFLPRVIDEIPLVDQMPTNTNSTTSPSAVPSGVEIKLNILTEAGATVRVNGAVPPAATGPYPLTGNPNWVTYGITGVTGNLKIESDKAVTAGINGGYSTSGYGGYFAGFSSIPIISKRGGDCIPGVILELDDGYDSYQWQLNGVNIPGATSHTYTPTVGGNYTCLVTMGSCPPVTTPIYKVYKCLEQTTAITTYCGSKKITPTFTNSTQAVVPGSVVIVTQPTHGTATVNTVTGVITYIPTQGSVTDDSFVYKFCGSNVEFPDCEQVTLTLKFEPLKLDDKTVYSCQYSGNGFFDLTSANVIDPAIPTTKKYYPTLADLSAYTNEITNPTNYFSGPGFIYVLVSTSDGCVANGKINLDFYPTPVVNEATISQCFLPNDETKAEFDLTTAIVTTEDPVTKKFYPTFVDASNGTNEITDPTHYIAGSGTVYVRVFNANTCYAITKITHTLIPPKRSTTLKDQYICIDSRTTIDAGSGFDSYLWSTGATTQSIQGVTVGEYWVTLSYMGCSLTQNVSVKKAITPVISSIDISNNTATVNVNGGATPYQYSVDGTTNWQDSNVFTNLTRGQHTFYVKDALNCAPVSVEITVPNLINAITPNGDNINDYIDYSELAYKDNLTFVIYDRYGNKIFTGDKFTNYKWDGKHANKKIITGTYWYHINWNEPNAQKTPIKYTGWILVKNRD